MPRGATLVLAEPLTRALSAGFTVQQIVNINPDIDPDSVEEGQTILLPAGNLSSRDKEILEGIGTVYRIYPVRNGESLEDIITKRSITRDEMSSMNPGANLDKLKGRSCMQACTHATLHTCTCNLEKVACITPATSFSSDQQPSRHLGKLRSQEGAEERALHVCCCLSLL